MHLCLQPASKEHVAAYTLHRETWIPAPLPQVFDFFSRAENLAALTPPWLGFRILTPPPIQMQQGARIAYKLRVHGLPIRWVTQIEQWNPPHAFIDVQLKGPYKLWRHTHRFVVIENGTLMADMVEIALPFGLIGSIAWRLRVRNDVKRIFDYRANAIRQHFPA